MKRTAVLILAALLLVSLCGCIGENENSGRDNTSSISSESSKPENDDRDRGAAEKLTEEIDGAYERDADLEENQTTVGMIELADKYAEKWEKVAEEYYNKLMSVEYAVLLDSKKYSSGEFREYIKNLKKTREEEMEKDMEETRSELEREYGGGTIIGPLLSDHNYELQMKWALELVGIYCGFEYAG